MTLRDAFAGIAPYLLEHPSDGLVRIRLRHYAFAKKDRDAIWHDLNDQCYQTLKLQLIAMGLVKVEYLKTTKDSMALFWVLTPQGRRLMFEVRTLQAAGDRSNDQVSAEETRREDN